MTNFIKQQQERAKNKFDQLPFRVTVPFNQEMMWGEIKGFEADGRGEFKVYLNTLIADTITATVAHIESEMGEQVDETEALFDNDPYDLLGEGYSIGYNTLHQKVTKILDKIKNGV